MEKLTRRKFFKSSALTLVAIPVLGKTLGLFNKAYALVRDDSTIKLQGYVHDSANADKTAYDKHMVKVTEFLTEIKKSDVNVTANCATCMQFKKDEADGFGECAMVLATGKADGKFVYKTGWCKVWTIGKDRIKKELGV